MAESSLFERTEAARTEACPAVLLQDSVGTIRAHELHPELAGFIKVAARFDTVLKVAVP